MMWWRRLELRVRSLAGRQRLEEELQGELEFHLAEQKAEYMQQGMSAAEAELAARRDFGPVAALAEECRDQRKTRWVEETAMDAKFALRTLRLSPGFACAAVATIALGFGANVAIFSTAYGVLLRPLPYPAAERLVEINGPVAGVGPVTALRAMSKTVDYAGALANVERNAQAGGAAVRIRTATATWNLTRVLGVAPVMGRWFAESEESRGNHRVAVISHAMWMERFRGDANVLGRRLLLNEESFEVIGVMPADFRFPTAATQCWTPIRMDPSDVGYLWGGYNLQSIGRLRDGVTMEAAGAELTPMVDRIRKMFPWRMPDAWGQGVTVVEHQQALVGNAQPKLLALAAASLFLLLIACANVSNLLLARWVRRSGEFAMREALGAGRGRLLRQLLTENGILATVGATSGAAVAWALLRVLPALLPDLPRMTEVGVDGRAACVSAAAMLAAFAALTILPMVRSLLPGAQVGGGLRTRARRLPMMLAGMQLALTTALLIGAGLMSRTLWQLENVDSGLHAPQRVTATMTAGPSRCASRARCWAFLQELTAALAGRPDVASVNWSNTMPLTRKLSAMSVAVQDHPRPAGAPAFVLWNVTVTPGYFASLGIPLRAGRLFTDADRAKSLPVAVISESTARRFWPKESALGKTIRPSSGGVGHVVVGVVGDVAHYSLAGFPSWVDGVQYLPLDQWLPAPGEAMRLTAFVEMRGATVSALLQALRQQFPDVVLSDVKTVARVREESVADRSSTAWLLAVLAISGLLLGAVGVYGVLTQRFAQRTRELGIRIALGATARQMVGVVLREAILVAAGGAVVGMGAAYALSRYLRSLLFGIAEHDALAFLGGPAVLVACAVLAALVPGIRAGRVDPATVLRVE